MSKRKMSFEEARRMLLESVRRITGLEGELVNVHFDNDDVPKFLKALQEAQERDNKTRLMVKERRSYPLSQEYFPFTAY